MFRRLLRARGFSTAAVLTFALGLAAATTVFSLVYGVLLRPLAYPRPDRLVAVSHTLVAGGLLTAEQSDATILFYQRHNRSFTSFAGYQATAAAVGTAGPGGADAERVAGGRVTADFFRALQIAPLAGRIFNDDDDRPAAARVVIVAERLWSRKFGRDRELLHRSIQVDGMPHEVVGVMPAAVRLPSADTEVWVPMRFDPAKTDSATFDFRGFGRLRDDVSLQTASEDLQALLPQLPTEFPGRMSRASIAQTRMKVSLRPLDAAIVGDIGAVLWIALGAAIFVLAISCTNVASLFLVRAEERRHALTVQRALGAGPGVIVSEFVAEACVIAALGGAIGVAAAWAGIRLFQSAGNVVNIPRLAEVGLDGTVVAAAAAASLAAALFVSVIPARSSRVLSAGSSLLASGRAATASRERLRARRVLVASQVALALVLLVGAGLMARSVWRLRSVRPGVDPAHAMTFRLALPPSDQNADAAVRFFVRALDAVAALPGVQSVGVASKLPLDDQGRTDSAVFVPDRPIPPGSLPGIHPVDYVTPGYFAAAGIPLLEGRTFAAPAPPRVELEAVVSRAFAARYWTAADAIGKQLRIIVNGPLYTVVGVAGDVRDAALDRPADQIVYVPILPPPQDRRWMPRDLAFVVRTNGSPSAVADAARAAVRAIDPSLPVYRIRAFSDIVDAASARPSFIFAVIGCASVVALLLGALGLYGVVSYMVTLRRREIGIRIALGARPDQVRRFVTRESLVMAIAGCAVGLGGAIALTRVLSSLLFEVSPTDAPVLALATVVMLTTASVASWLPARRAAAVDPATTIRTD